MTDAQLCAMLAEPAVMQLPFVLALVYLALVGVIILRQQRVRDSETRPWREARFTFARRSAPENFRFLLTMMFAWPRDTVLRLVLIPTRILLVVVLVAVLVQAIAIGTPLRPCLSGLPLG